MVCNSLSHPCFIERDLKVIWHPFTQRLLDPNPRVFISARGSYLYDLEGRGYLDAISSWWVNLHGHAHPHLAAAIAQTASQLDQILFTDFTHPLAITLAEQLLGLLPSGYSRVFFSDNGSTAVEAALKMAIQSRFQKGKTPGRILALAGGYHGDTLGAMGAGGRQSLFSRPFAPYLFEAYLLDPFSEEALLQLKTALQEESFTALIYEPSIQGSGGMRLLPHARMEQILSLCRQAGLLLIADEVMTGFGRTGPIFASSHYTIEPDIICLAKGLTGGYLPLGVTLCREEIYEAFLSKERLQCFLHGHSYTANPLSCASSLASLELLISADCSAARHAIAAAHSQFCQTSRCRQAAHIKRLESLGTILILEYSGEGGYSAPVRDALIRHFFARQILVRPLGNVLYILPPYCIRNEELALIYQTIEEFVC